MQISINRDPRKIKIRSIGGYLTPKEAGVLVGAVAVGFVIKTITGSLNALVIIPPAVIVACFFIEIDRKSLFKWFLGVSWELCQMGSHLPFMVNDDVGN